jgi:hypothetical protein
MKKHVIIFCTAALLSVAGFSQSHDGHNHAAATTPTPAVVTETLKFTETSHDFGKIPQGKPVTYVFMLENTGKDSLKLDNVQASCGCTTPEWSKSAIAPGAKSSIKVGYNAAAEGPFEKTITVYYNGGQTKVLIIKGSVWKTPDQSAPTNQALNVFKQ